jgi:flagellar M-ring protein FliF
VKPGSSVNQAQVRAITNLVASSVEDLEPANVVVVDTEGMLLAGGQEEGTEGAAGQTDNQRAAEVQAAAEVRSKVQSILDQVLGPNRAIVQASVAMDWNQKEIISSSFEPTPSAIRSSYKVDESYESNGDTAGDVPGAETNLPETAEGQALAAIEGGASTYNRSEETINYEISQTETHETIAPGQIKQLSLSVMVDGVEDQGQLDAIKAAAAAAAGIDETRGDMIVVESMAFDRSYYEAQAADLEASSQQDLYMQIGIAVAAALALIGLMVYFQRTLQKARRGSTAEWRPVLRPVAEMALQQAQQAGLPDAGNKRLPSQKSRELPKKTDEELLAEISNRSGNGDFPQDEQRARIISRLSEENPATVAEIIQIWLSEDDRKNS